MRIIDADELIEHAWRDKLDSRELIVEMINNAPTVKEIPTKIPIDVFEKLISQEPCEDCISRQAAHEAIERWAGSMSVLTVLSTREVRPLLDSIHELPPAIPQPKIGHWIRVDKDKCKCDQCEVISFIATYPFGHKNYCPNCGAKMLEEEE